MEMNNHQGGINRMFNYLLLAFFMLIGPQFTFGQKYKDYVILEYANQKITGNITLNKKFWYSTITFENEDEALYEYYAPNQLQGFVKGDSVFIVVRVNTNKFKENGVPRRNYALLLTNTSAVKLYKSYIPLGSGKVKEVFFYSKQGSKDAVLIEDSKNSVLSAVSDCFILKKEINQSNYEYSESYLRRLFENYSKCQNDSTGTLVTRNPMPKPGNKSLSDTTAIAPSNLSETTIVKADSLSNADTTTLAPVEIVSVTPKSDNAPSSDATAIVEDKQSEPAPFIDGFAAGDSILYENNGLYPGQFLNPTKNGKCSINFKGMGGKVKTQTVSTQTVYQTSDHLENKEYYGYDLGDDANIEVFVTKLNTKVIKPCIIVGLNKTRLVINYTTDEGKERVLSVDKSLIK